MYVCLSVVSRKNWQYLQSLVVRILVSNPSEKAYSLVENAKKMGNRMPFLYTGAQFPLLVYPFSKYLNGFQYFLK